MCSILDFTSYYPRHTSELVCTKGNYVDTSEDIQIPASQHRRTSMRPCQLAIFIRNSYDIQCHVLNEQTILRKYRARYFISYKSIVLLQTKHDYILRHVAANHRTFYCMGDGMVISDFFMKRLIPP